MSDNPALPSTNLGLRDILSYLIPGGVVLTGMTGLLGITPDAMKEWGTLWGSIVGLFAAYFLGQMIYPVTYPLRRWFAPQGEWTGRAKEFAQLHFEAVEKYPAYYGTVVFRDRSLARFALAMVCPTTFLTVVLVFRIWDYSLSQACLVGITGLLATAGFVWRYRRYDHRYHARVLLCGGKDFKDPGAVDSLD